MSEWKKLDKNKLPKGAVLLYERPKIYVGYVTYTNGDEFMFVESDSECWMEEAEPTHWMPLPKKPKKGE